MILKFKYHSDTGLLEAYQSYILAQNSSNSDSVVITSTASDATKYDYCLEFVCYNSKNIPKAQYISPILHYNDGITFTLPNNITEYKGHVDMQLTGYLPEDNTVVFKSIAKNCKAFDVEGSLNVLESDLGETPNVLTEVMKELDALNNIHEEIVQNARDEFEQVCADKLKDVKYHRVRFFVFNTLVKSCYVMAGHTVTAPVAEQLDMFDTDGKWYLAGGDSIESYKPQTLINGDKDYVYNFWSKGLEIDYNGYVTGFAPESESEMYIVFPECVNGKRIKGLHADYENIVSDTVTEIFISSSMTEECNLYKLKCPITTIYVNPCNPNLHTEDGVLYSKDSLVYYRLSKSKYAVRPLTKKIKKGAICENSSLKMLIIPEGVLEIEKDAVTDNANLERIYLPSTIEVLGTNCMHDNGLSTENRYVKIYIAGDICDVTEVASFGNTSYHMLYVDFEDANKYTMKLSTYGVPVMVTGYETMKKIFQSKI